MTEIVIFDTDCLSSFLCVSQEGILNQLYNGRLAISEHVLQEFLKRHDLGIRVQKLVTQNYFQVISIEIATREYELYSEYSSTVNRYHPAMGKGESSVIAIAQTNGYTVASDNLRDIRKLIEYLKLSHLTTPDILVSALKNNIITVGKGNVIWRDLQNNGRRIPYGTFSDYLNSLEIDF